MLAKCLTHNELELNLKDGAGKGGAFVKAPGPGLCLPAERPAHSLTPVTHGGGI